MTVKDAYLLVKESLTAEKIEDAGFEAKLIVKQVTGQDVFFGADKELSETDKAELLKILKKRQTRYPLQYILGEWDFYKYTFKVGEGVLVPRSDTEILVEECCKFLKNRQTETVLDLCAGSGCIGISLAKDFPHTSVTLVEKFEGAFHYLKENIKLNSAQNAKAVKGDIFDGTANESKYGLIVSNPPYIPPKEMEIISPETEFEPKTALLGGQDGLDFYRSIIKNYKQSLKTGGMFAFEVGINEDTAVADLLRTDGFTQITVTKDLNGISRVVTAIK